MRRLWTRLRRREPVKRAYMDVDLTGSRVGPNILSARFEVRAPGEFAERMREAAAEFYRVPLEQVGAVEVVAR